MSRTETSKETLTPPLDVTEVAEFIGPLLAGPAVEADLTLVETQSGKRHLSYTSSYISGLGNPDAGGYYDM